MGFFSKIRIYQSKISQLFFRHTRGKKQANKHTLFYQKEKGFFQSLFVAAIHFLFILTWTKTHFFKIT